jgi:hypothetical protein
MQLRPVLIGLVALSIAAPRALSDPVPGFLETWPGTSLDGWTGGATYTNPGDGGTGGAEDGFLLMSRSSPGSLAVFSSDSEYLGNWRAAGIRSVHLWLNDVGADDSLEIHFMILSGPNFWFYNTAFSPPAHDWGEFVVDLSSAANFTHVLGTGTFEDALADVDRIQIRHDTPPFAMSADAIQGDVGIDHLELVGPTNGVRPVHWGTLKALYR